MRILYDSEATACSATEVPATPIYASARVGN
jgi:hypothetical protein